MNGRFVKVTLTKHEQKAWEQLSNTDRSWGYSWLIEPNELPEDIQKQVDEVTEIFISGQRQKIPLHDICRCFAFGSGQAKLTSSQP